VTSIPPPGEATVVSRMSDSSNLVGQKNPASLVTSLQEVRGVLACSALRQKYRGTLIHGSSGDDVEDGGNGPSSTPVIFVALCGDEETILPRLKNRRGHYMPPSLLQSQLETLEMPTKEEGKGYILVLNLNSPVEELVRTIIHELSPLLLHL